MSAFHRYLLLQWTMSSNVSGFYILWRAVRGTENPTDTLLSDTQPVPFTIVHCRVLEESLSPNSFGEKQELRERAATMALLYLTQC